MKKRGFKLIEGRIKEKWYQDDIYLNGYAKVCGWKATLAYVSLCRHASKEQKSFPSYQLMAKEHDVSESTIKRGIQKLIEYNIIAKGQQRGRKSGKFLFNTYTLVDKSEWKRIHRRSPQTHGNRRSPQTETVGLPRPMKDTHIEGYTTRDVEKNKLIKKLSFWAYERADTTPGCGREAFKKSVAVAIERRGVDEIKKISEFETNAITFLKNIKND